MFKPLVFCFVLLTSAASFAQMQEPKIYSAAERTAEEARIAKEIAENLDWHNLDPKQLDGVADSERWLYGTKNQSILLSKVTRQRFGIFEAFNDKNQKGNEIRFHKKNILTHRFYTYDVECEGSISAEKVASQYVLYETSCAQRKKNGKFEQADHVIYLFDYASQNLYFLDGFRMDDFAKFFIERKGNKYRYEVTYKYRGKKLVTKRTFSILKNSQGEWIVKEPAIDNDESGALNPIEALPKLPLDPKYNLPDVMNWDE
jgi:hypothetical protein